MEVDGGAAENGGGAEQQRGSEQEKGKEKEGRFLLGWPTFMEIGGGRLRCAETGHELPARERDAYAKSKGCRLGLIDAALSKKKAPLNLFRPHPLSKSKLVCELTGDTVNKSEEHIWNHINGRRFNTKLEQKEAEKLAPTEKSEKDAKQEKKQSRKAVTVKKIKKEEDVITSMPREPVAVQSSDSEEVDFWIPPVGDRWDFDDGKDRWRSCTSSDTKTDDSDDNGDVALGEEDKKDDSASGELSIRTKRMSIAVGPSSFASRKKKIKKTPSLINSN